MRMIWQLAPGLSSAAALPSHMDVSSSQEWDGESEWESSYGEDTGCKTTWEKLS